MLYIINGKYYVNISPSIYVEVAISKDGDITPTENKIETNASTYIRETTLAECLRKTKETEQPRSEYVVGRRYNTRKK